VSTVADVPPVSPPFPFPSLSSPPDADARHAPRALPRGAFTVQPPSIAERLVDRFQDWRNDRGFGVVVLVVIAVVAGVIWYRLGVGGGDDASAAPRTRASEPSTATSAPPTSSTVPKGASAQIVVHVAGAVTTPGVVELDQGARVIDALEAVGGAHADADLDRLNLAAKVTDGERFFVPKVGQADPGVVAGGTAGGSAGGASGAATPGGKLNLNTATQAQLEELPGIGPTYAQAIIAERERRGGFTSINELRSVRGIGDKRFSEIAPLVTV
jgi:competence protein ComEA